MTISRDSRLHCASKVHGVLYPFIFWLSAAIFLGFLGAGFIHRFGADLRSGTIRPVIDTAFAIADAGDAHRRMAGDHFGKIVLQVR